MKVEKPESSNQERSQKKAFSRGGSSSGKRVRELQVDSVHGSATRGRRQWPNVAPSSSKGMASEQGEIWDALIATSGIRVFAEY